MGECNSGPCFQKATLSTTTTMLGSPIERPIAMPHINGKGAPHPDYRGSDKDEGLILPAEGRIVQLGPKGFDRVVRLKDTEIYFRLTCIEGEFDTNGDDQTETVYHFMATETDRGHGFFAQGYYKNQPIYEVYFEAKPGVPDNGDGFYTHRLNILDATGDLDVLMDEDERKYAWAVSYHDLGDLNDSLELSPIPDTPETAEP